MANASRAAPLGPGPEAVVAAFGSISPMGIAIALDPIDEHTTFDAVWAARNEAVSEGLVEHSPSIVEPMACGQLPSRVARRHSLGIDCSCGPHSCNVTAIGGSSQTRLRSDAPESRRWHLDD